MDVHQIHDLGQADLIKPYEPIVAVCGYTLKRAHEIKRVESDTDVCPRCLSLTKRNRYQNFKLALDLRV